MRVVVITKAQTDYARTVETFLEDFSRQTGRVLEVLDPETPEGESFCRAHDILQYPSVVALGNVGGMEVVQHIWSGALLPTINEVNYYASQN
jgi:hypothetical protein